MHILYSLLWYCLLPFLFIRLYWRGRLAPAYRQRWNERLAYRYGGEPLAGCVWFHAVSVGEFMAAAPLIDAVMTRHPDTPILITTTTPTGSARVQERFGDRVHHVYCPWELPGALRRFMRHFNPRLAVIMETELWPNLTRIAEQHNCRLLLANGRLSANSYRGYAKLRALVQPLLQRFDCLSVQTAGDAKHFLQLGADPQAVVVNGSIKFDLSLSDALRDDASALRHPLGERPVWIAASTHPEEEAKVLAAQQQLLTTHPDALLIWVPRHPERFDAVAQQVQSAHLSLARRSQRDAVTRDTCIYLADTMGELLLLYGVADVALVGGSLDAALGGHNLLEPAAWEKPVLSGIHLKNFMAIADLLEAAGGLQKVESAQQLGVLLGRLLDDAATRQMLGEKAASVVAANRGALARLITQVDALWPKEL